MKLENYLLSNSIPVAVFAEKVGVKRQTIYSYIQGKKLPRPEAMKRISEITSGEVTPNDFYGLEDGKC